MAMEIHVSIVDNSKGSILLSVPLTIRVHVARLHTVPHQEWTLPVQRGFRVQIGEFHFTLNYRYFLCCDIRNCSPLWAMAFHCQHTISVQRGSGVYMQLIWAPIHTLLGTSCVISGSVTLWNYSLLWDMVLYWQYSNFQARNIPECLYRCSRVYVQWKQT